MGLLNGLANDIRFDNASKGFDPTLETIDRYLLLVVSEIVEGQEELRDGRAPNEVYYEDNNPGRAGQLRKPCGFPSEMADALIRILDICAKFNIDIDAIVQEKLAFNRSRPPKHGRQF